MLEYVDTKSPNPQLPPEQVPQMGMEGHVASPIPKDKKEQTCVVCMLEIGDGISGKGSKPGMRNGVKKGLAHCQDCGMTANYFVPTNKKKIHDLECFQNMSCFAILHSSDGYTLWANRGPDKKHSVKTGCPIYLQLQEMYGRPKKTHSSKKRRTEDGESTAVSSLTTSTD